MKGRVRRAAPLALVVSWGCRGAGGAGDSAASGASALPPAVEAHPAVSGGLCPEIELREASPGLSGAAVDPASGDLWLASDTRAMLYRLPRDRWSACDGKVEDGPSFDPGRDAEAESLAFLPDGRLAVGLEGDAARRAGDRVLAVEIGTGSAADLVDLTYAGLPLPRGRPEGNDGIEGLAVAGGSLWAGIEPWAEAGGKRYGFVGRVDLPAGSARWWSVPLPGSAKIAALEADPVRPGGMVAILRHYGISRLVRVAPGSDELAPGPAPGWPPLAAVEPWVDLAAAVPRDTPNFEAVVFDRDGAPWVVNDNHRGGSEGPSLLRRVRVQ